jgi:hypothetical protein
MRQAVGFGAFVASAYACPERAFPLRGLSDGLAHADTVGAVGSGNIALANYLVGAVAPCAPLEPGGVYGMSGHRLESFHRLVFGGVSRSHPLAPAEGGVAGQGF